MQFAPQSPDISENQWFQFRRAMDAQMRAGAKGDQQIRSIASVVMINYGAERWATTAAAKAAPHQHPLARAAKEAQRMKRPIITSTAATQMF
jgi:hypothetical protein